jgi:hypothetical protein
VGFRSWVSFVFFTAHYCSVAIAGVSVRLCIFFVGLPGRFCDVNQTLGQGLRACFHRTS